MNYPSTISMRKVFLFSLPGVPDGNPLTNYYQLSLDLLTLCLFNGSYSITEVKNYFTPENKNFYFGGQFSVGESLNSIPSVISRPCPQSFSTSKYLDFFYFIYPSLLRREFSFFRRMETGGQLSLFLDVQQSRKTWILSQLLSYRTNGR